jgi:peptidoglycan/xylan/chitin deacetylase (PgdA/CDA1 family)
VALAAGADPDRFRLEQGRVVYTLIKARVEHALASEGVSRVTRLRVRGKRLILAYHGIVPDGTSQAGERALFIAQRTFGDHLDMLREVADVVALDRLDEEGDGRPRVAITFDDAYNGAVREGAHELARRGLPATIFAVPLRLDGGAFWWDVLSDGRATLDEAVRSHALTSLGGVDERVRAWAERLRLPSAGKLPRFALPATYVELRTALSLPGITVGSHSWAHANLTALDERELEADLDRSRTWLQAEFGNKAVNWLAYPYGLESPTVQRVAASVGYTGALRIAGGWHRLTEVSRFARPRLNVPSGMSTAGLRARVLGAVLA